MKSLTSLFALSFSAGLLALTLTGCSSFPGSKSSTPNAAKPVGGKAINLLQLRDNVKSTRVALNRTTDALNRIPTAPNALEAYNAFSVELAAFKKLSTSTLEDSADVRNRGKDLFAQWELETASIKDDAIRAVAQERRNTLNARYDAMITPLITARADLTPAGIAALKKPLADLNRKAAVSATSLDKFAAELDQIAAILPNQTVAPVK
jgi:hypothetical protein